MSDIYEQLEAIQRQLPAIRKRLSSKDADAFEQQAAAIANEARDHPERAQELAARLSEVTSAIGGIGEPPRRTVKEPNPQAASAPPIRSNQTRAAAPSPSSRIDNMETNKSRTHSEAARAAEPAWTPELKLQAFKELITGIVGVAVIGYTLFVAYQTLNFVGDQTKLSQAKDVLTLLLGLAGVVLGYYFGRMPADARAADATHNATTATAHAELVKAKAREFANEVVEVTENGATRGEVSPENLASLRAKAREIANMT